jgi:hypothetical protein
MIYFKPIIRILQNFNMSRESLFIQELSNLNRDHDSLSTAASIDGLVLLFLIERDIN